MLISLPELINKYNLNIKGVVQCGAHWAEEHNVYVELGIKNIVYIEPCKEAFYKMPLTIWGASIGEKVAKEFAKDEYSFHQSDGLSMLFFNSACGEEEGEFDMYVSNDNQGQSNSLLKPMLHLQQHKEIVFNDYETVKVVPLDSLPFQRESYNLLVLDTQGSEGLVLKGATETLKHIDCIYTEVNRDYTYEGNMLIEEMDEYLRPFGFYRVETFWPSPSWSWGDAFYTKFYKIEMSLDDVEEHIFDAEPIKAVETLGSQNRIFLP